MPINRCQLHESKFELFKIFLINKGWSIQDTKSIYECIRATKKDNNPIILYQRDGTKHATIGWDMEHAYKLVRNFINRSNQ